MQQNDKAQYQGYCNIQSADICVAMCFFNPLNYKNNLKNIKLLLQEFSKTNIPIYVLELLYPGQSSSIPNANVVVKAETVFLSKKTYGIF